MFGLFKKTPTIHKSLAESVALSMAEDMKAISSAEFMKNAEQLVRNSCERMGIWEELRDQEYREICQLAVRLASGDRSRSTIDQTLKSF